MDNKLREEISVTIKLPFDLYNRIDNYYKDSL